MKLSETSKKLTCVKSMIFRVLAGATLAGAALAAAPAAHAQRWSVGVRVGPPAYYYAPAPAYSYYGPTYYGPSYYGRGYDQDYSDHERWEAWRRHEAHEAWERRMRYEDWARDHRRYDDDDEREEHHFGYDRR